MKAALPSQEMARLQTLRQYRILDTINESAFDDLTRLAAQICSTPIALISLVDESRLWFKSKIGLDESSISRDLAFCAHAILQPDTALIISDTLLDHRFATNPLVTFDPNIRFYAGVPLVTSQGHALGTLCVIDFIPRQLTKEQVEALHTLSRQVVAQLDLRLNLHKLERITTNERQRSENLISALSHHMRTPLLATRGTLRALLGGAFGSIDDTWRQIFENCHSSNEELLKLVEALLNVSRYTSKCANLSCEIIDWKTIFTRAIKSSNNTSDKKCEITYKIAPSLPTTWGDEFEIQQVVQNLLDYAVLRSEHPGQITLEAAPMDVDKIKVSVHSYKLEIAPQEKEKLFHDFSTAQDRRGKAGLLGLYLCRLIVEAHGGMIDVESSLSDGNTFWFTLPAALDVARLKT